MAANKFDGPVVPDKPSSDDNPDTNPLAHLPENDLRSITPSDGTGVTGTVNPPAMPPPVIQPPPTMSP